MTNLFFEKPILNSPYGYPARYWELDQTGQPTQQIIEKRRPAEFITPIPKPKKQKGGQQEALLFDDLDLLHTGDVRPSQVVYELTSHLVLSKWRDANGEAQLHLFGQLKRIARQWLDGGYLKCVGGTYPAQLKYKRMMSKAVSA